MLISAVSDLDVLGKNINIFWEILKTASKPDLLLFAGDMYDSGKPKHYSEILDMIDKKGWKCPIVAVFGNREFENEWDTIKKICGKRITFLCEESAKLKINGRTVGIVGTKGSLDSPTFWQSRNNSGIKNVYSERIEKIEQLLKGLKADIKILLMHYSPTYKTLVGENPAIWGGLGSPRYESVMLSANVTFAVHGHAHYGSRLGFVGNIPVFNAALNVNGKIVEIDTDNLPKTGLRRFFK